MDFKRINNIGGWVVFTISTLVYLVTVEETASYWDCGEFIAVSYKLMVPHPPGAPFFLLLGRIFSFFSLGNVNQVAFWINMISVISSGFTILFLFWTISMFARKVLGIEKGAEISAENTWKIVGASTVGALAYTFSDSFWFSAVEAEVYALSSFFTAFVVWAILKWELIDDESRANRWLILIAYMMGLSIGVHLLNLVTIPALGLIYYFKKYKISTWGLVATMLVSGGIVILINNIIIPGLPSIAGGFEIFFVNSMGLPFGSGAAFFAICLIAALVWGIFYSIKNQKTLLNTGLLGLAFVLIGYSSYTIVLVRSQYNTPIDQNNPEDIMSFVKYLKREQYGSRPLMKGQYFNSEVKRDSDGRAVTSEGDAKYRKGKDKYIETGRDLSYEYERTTILPRMYSSDPNHIRRYREITGLREGEDPTFVDNVTFMFKHQIGWMYLRYFLWNFAGRESDIQDAGWMTPFQANENVPREIKENKGRNNYFMIPLFLGIVGLFFQLSKDKKNFAVVTMLFFLTGLALILYLNSPPVEPRERDYIYAGSYYAFAIWIGFSVLAFAELFGRFASKGISGMLATALCLSGPLIMAQQNWDDHDRSNRFFSVDSAKNFLSSCAPNAIIYTGGDNDTFPLWYSQDVEGYRTDMRVVVLSYYNTDWYISQMMRQAYESPAFPFTLTYDNYLQGGLNDYLPFVDQFKLKSIDLKQYLELIKKNDKRLEVYSGVNALPSRTLTLDVDVNKVRGMGIIPEGMDSLVVNRMVFNMKRGKNALEKKDLAILDNLATNNWERPIYINNTSMQQISFDLAPYAVQEGNAFRILPIKNPNPRAEFVNVEAMYDNMMNKFQFRELNDANVYFNEDYRNFVQNHRSSFNTLASALIEKGDKERARKAILYSLEKIPGESVPFDLATTQTVSILFELGEIEKAKEIADDLGNRAIEMAEYLSENGDYSIEMQRRLYILADLQRTLLANGEEEMSKKYDEAYDVITGSLDRSLF